MKSLKKIAWIVAIAILVFSVNSYPVLASTGGDVATDQSVINEASELTAFQVKQILDKRQATAVLKKMSNLKIGIDYDQDEILVSVTSESEAQTTASAYGATLKHFSKHGYAVLQLGIDSSVIEAVKTGASESNSLPAAFPNFIYQADSIDLQGIPDDPDFVEQYFHPQIGSAYAWDISIGLSSTLVAVIDTGIDVDHPEFNGKISNLSLNAYTNATGLIHVQDDNGHGTHVSGIIAAAHNNSLGGSGVAPGTSILAIKANIPGSSSFWSEDLIESIYYAADQGARVINMSLGRSFDSGSDPIEQEAIRYAVSKGAIVVCAAGNDSSAHANYPAAYPETIAVSAANSSGKFDQTYSNYGPEIDLIAPGTDIYSTYLDGSFAWSTGTSMASPIAAGAAALLVSHHPELSPEEVRSKLYATAVDKGTSGYDVYYGYGQVNAANSLATTLYQVDFMTDGGSEVPSIKAAANTPIFAPEVSKAGYSFNGWYTEPEFLNPWNFSSNLVSENLTLYAKWNNQILFKKMLPSGIQYPFYSPFDVAIGPTGTVYVADTYNQRITVFDAYGSPLFEFGSTGTGEGQFLTPMSIALDSLGNIYTIDAGTNRIQKFDPEGKFLTQWGGSAVFSSAFGLAVDANDFVYVSDLSTNKIYKYDANGTLKSSFGSSGTLGGQFNSPSSLLFDAKGNILVVDSGNNRVQVLTSTGSFIKQFGSSGTGDGQFARPFDIAMDDSGQIYITDRDNHRVQKFDANYRFLSKWGSFGNFDNGKLAFPKGIAFDNNRLYVADEGNDRLQIFGADGMFLEQWGKFGDPQTTNKFIAPFDLDVDASGNLYVLDRYNVRIQKFDQNGQYMGKYYDPSYDAKGALIETTGLAVDPSGNIYLAHSWIYQIKKISPDGEIILSWGSFGESNGKFTSIGGLAVDSLGSVYAIDVNTCRIQKFDANGNFILSWGSPGSGNGNFDAPMNIAVDADGYVYVSDFNNHRIQKFTSTGDYVTQWGRVGSGAGEFIRPNGIAIDLSGNILVADEEAHTIQTFTPDGQFISVVGQRGSGDNQFFGCSAIAVNQDGEILVTDQGNARIMKANSITEIQEIGTPAHVTISTSPDYTANLNWSAVASADGYEIFRSTSPTGPYSSLASIAGTDYEDREDLANGTYYYTVKAFRFSGSSKLSGNDSSVVSWTKDVPIIYTVAFDSNGGSAVPFVNVMANDLLTAPDEPTKTGCTFLGWYKDTALTQIFNFDTEIISSQLTLYAKWQINTYTVTFDSQSGSAVPSKTANYNTLITAPSAPTRYGYTFAGWYMDDDLTTTWNFSTMKVQSDLTLYAKWTPLTYTVTFNSNGGTSVASKTVPYESIFTAPANPTKLNYTFAGWYRDVGLTSAWVFATDKVLGAMTLYAKWTPGEYTVTYNSNGGSAIDPVKALYNTKLTAPTPPTREGYTFVGWYKDTALTSIWTFTTNVVTKDLTLYAKWKPIAYTVTFVSNGGTAVASKIVNYDAKIIAPTAPTRTGWTFMGWYKDSGLTTPWLFATDVVKGPTTLYAKWQIVVKFVSNGGTLVSPLYLDASGLIEKPTDPTRTGYTFVGWYKDSTLTKPIDFATETVTKNMTLYAKWLINTYTVTFESNGGTAVADKLAKYNTYLTAPTSPTKYGYTFAGWYKETDLITKWGFSTMKVVDNMTLYAKWTPKSFTVTFNSQGGTSVAAKSVSYLGLVPAPTPPTKIGHTFAGWYKDLTFSDDWSFASDTVLGAMTLYAKWTPNEYTVTYNSNGGSAIAPVKALYNTKLTAPTPPTRDGYTFVGWYKDAALSSVWTFTTNVVTKDLTLFAKWKPIAYTVTFVSNGGTAVASKLVNYDAKITAPSNPTRTGYIFAGWYKDSDLSDDWVFASDIVKGPTTLYARWLVSPAANFTALAVSKTEIKLSWTTDPVAQGYEIYRATSSGGTYTKISGDASGGEYIDTGLTTGKTYYYKLRPWTMIGMTKVYGVYSPVRSAPLIS